MAAGRSMYIATGCNVSHIMSHPCVGLSLLGIRGKYLARFQLFNTAQCRCCCCCCWPVILSREVERRDLLFVWLVELTFKCQLSQFDTCMGWSLRSRLWTRPTCANINRPTGTLAAPAQSGCIRLASRRSSDRIRLSRKASLYEVD